VRTKAKRWRDDQQKREINKRMKQAREESKKLINNEDKRVREQVDVYKTKKKLSL
jgi:hypothetical protein